MKCSLGISNFLEEISSLSPSIVFLYFLALITEEAFLSLLAIPLELCIQMGISFLFCFTFHFSSYHTYLEALLSDQCKEIEENNRMGKTRDLFNKIRDIKGAFHAEMGSVKDRNNMDLTEAEEIKKRWQEYTEEHKKDHNEQDKHNGVITHLEPDILECEVKWALESITMNKASGSD